VREITVDEWRAGYFVVRPTLWRMLVREKVLPRVVVHCEYEVVKDADVVPQYERTLREKTVTVKEPDEIVLEGKK
jgi:hypothetical protein